MNLTRQNWPLGWTPSADRNNGDPGGLLRMDDLQQEESGAIGLVRDFTQIKAASGQVVKIHSRSAGGEDYLWYGTSSGRVQEVKYDGSVRYGGDIIASGGSRPAITDIYGWIYALSGGQRKKFDGANLLDIGLDTPKNAPRVAGASQSTTDLAGSGTFAMEEGHDDTPSANGIDIHADTTSLRGSAVLTLSGTTDLLKIGGSGQASAPENDTFSFLLQLGDSSAFTKIRVEFILDANNNDYYWYEWDLTAATELRPGIDQFSTLKSTRGRFNRQGNELSLDWQTVRKVRFIAYALSDEHVQFRDPIFVGGEKGQLYGAYQYVYIYAHENGQYINKGPKGPLSNTVEVLNGAVYVETDPPDNNEEFPQAWIFRRSVPSTAQYYDSLQGAFVQLPTLLSQFYLVAKTDPGATIIDSLSDNDAIQQNITLNEFLLAAKSIPGNVIDVLGPYFDRVLYLTDDSLYLSEPLNPECVDTRQTIKLSSALIDHNFWIKKVNNTVLLIGASQDVYQLSGTLESLPDGTIDVFVRALGEKYPPLSYDVASVEGLLFYVGSNGVRTTNGTGSQLLSPQLSSLFQKLTRHGLKAVNAVPSAVQSFPIAVAHNKLFVGLPFLDGIRRLAVYSFIDQTWALRVDPVTGLGSTESDNIVFGLDTIIASAETSETYTNINARQIELRTIADDNKQPRNRKEPFTLKLTGDTGGMNLTVEISVNDAPFVNFGQFNQTGIATQFYDLATLPKGFRYQLRLSGSVKVFKLIEYTIEYNAYPEQLVYLHIPNTNFGTSARKRVGQMAFVIDTLSNTVQFTPVVDGVILSPLTATLVAIDKQTKIFQFTSETIGIDFGGFLESTSGQPFEFYDMAPDKMAYEVLPGAYDFLFLSPSNFGTPNRKAFTSIKFGLDSKGDSVTFIPILDGVRQASQFFATAANRPTTCEYFFDSSLEDVTAIDIGFEIKYTAQVGQMVGFEFYGPPILQNLEVLPPRLKSLYIRETNFDVASKKRLRTIPIIINTNGANVTFTPILDGVTGTSSVINGSRKRTLFHYFKTDVFVTDFAAFLSSGTPFEFYNFGKLEDVEVLPVGKKYDQLGPIRFDKIGKLFRMRIRLVATGNVLPITFYDDTSNDIPGYANPVYAINLDTTPNVDRVYELDLPKNINSGIFRFTIGPTDDIFYRYDCLVQVSRTGMETDKEWLPTSEIN